LGKHASSLLATLGETTMTDPSSPLSAPLYQLAQAMTHLQPDQLECIYGVCRETGEFAHLQLPHAAPLLILGEQYKEKLSLVSALLAQLYAMHDPRSLRAVLLDPLGSLAPLFGACPQTHLVVAAPEHMRAALLVPDRQAVSALLPVGQPPTRPAWVVVVMEFHRLLCDWQAWMLLQLLLRDGHERGIYVIATSHYGDQISNARFTTRVCFGLDPALARLAGIAGHSLLRQLARQNQPNSFFIEGPGGLPQGLLTVPVP
jgi:hypothetical protein